MPHESAAFRISCDPPDPSFRRAPEAAKRDYYRHVVILIKEAFAAQLEAGKDRHGRDLFPLAYYTILHRRSAMGKADPTAPPLIPAHGLSRTISLLDGRAFPDHAEMFWRDHDDGQHWGQILKFHRAGRGRFGPIPRRDVIGLAPAYEADVRQKARQFWHGYQNGVRVAAAAARMRLPARTPAAAPGTPRPLPRPFAATGRTDIENATFGINASQARTARAIHEGYHSGFTRRSGSAPTYGGGVPVLAPRPRPVVPRLPSRVAAAARP